MLLALILRASLEVEVGESLKMDRASAKSAFELFHEGDHALATPMQNRNTKFVALRTAISRRSCRAAESRRELRRFRPSLGGSKDFSMGSNGDFIVELLLQFLEGTRSSRAYRSGRDSEGGADFLV